ncbi:phage tail length tape measure family protein [Profundibacter sp.]
MTINLSMLLKADASQAKTELAATGKAASSVSKATEKLGRKGKTAAAGTKALGTSAGAAKSQLRQLSVEEVRATATVGKLGAANKAAAGSVGNLVAQFNDVGVMMAAGQNPLQLALQQGTQITQVIGPMGAAGAVKALGSAFMSMLSPINFITIGAIAAGAAMVGWLRESGPAAMSLEERIDSLSEGIDRYRASVRDARMDTASMIERFGSGATEARKYLEALTEVRRREALLKTGPIAEKVTVGRSSADYADLYSRHDITAQFGLGTDRIGSDLRDNLVKEVGAAYAAIDATTNDTIKKQIAAWQRTYDATVKAAEAVDGVSESENQRLSLIAEQILRLQELLALDEASKRAADAAVAKQQDMLAELEREVQINEAIAQYGADSAQVANLRLAHERELYAQRVEELGVAKELKATLMATFDKANPPRNPMAEWAASAYEYAAARVKANYQEATSAQKMLQTLQQENAIRAAILRYGEGSAQVAELRAAAEQRVFEATLDTLNISAELKDELRAAFEKGQALAGLNMAGGVASAAVQAERMAVALGISLETATKIAAMGGQKGGGAGRGGDPRAQGGSISDWQNKDAIVFLENYKAPRISRGGGGGGATRKEQNAAKDLIKDLKQELAILRETDPAQKEMLRNREALAQATTAEKATIADLIAQRNNETRTLEQQKETWDFLKDTAYGSLDSLILQGESLSDVMDNLAQSIQSAALQAILLGEGPLASLLGTGGSGGLIGMALGAMFPSLKPAAIPANATGGMIYGPGDGTSDDVLMWGSSGEFMVNAAATKKHRGLLELINSGNDIPGYAAGGLVAPAYMRGQGGGSGGMAPPPLIVIENNSSAAITGETEETVDSSGRRSSRLVLADAVGDAMTTAGGGADRVLKRKYGLRPGAAMR